MKTKDPDTYKFDKETYWERRRKGLSGIPPAPGSAKHRQEARKIARQAAVENLERMKKGKPHERKKRKSTSKSV